MSCIEKVFYHPLDLLSLGRNSGRSNLDVASIRPRGGNGSPSAKLKRRTILTRRLAKTAVAFVVAGALWFFVAAPQAHADDRSRCQHAVEKAEARYDRAVQKDGEHSHEAEERRRDLNAERQRCWDQYHQWWNGREHRWETEQNWDNDHHDHDHDQH